MHRFDIDPRNHRDNKEVRVSRTYFDRICRALDKLALLRLRQDDGPEFGLVESYHLAKRGGEAQKKDVVAGRGCFVVRMLQSLLDHLAADGVGRRGNLRIVPFLDWIFYGVSANAYAIAKRMMAQYYFCASIHTKNRHKLRVQTLMACCPALNAKLPADRRRTFIEALASLAMPTISGNAMMPCRYADDRPPVAYEDWLDAVIEFEPHEVEFISRGDLDTAHDLFRRAAEQEPTHDDDTTVDEQQSEPQLQEQAEPAISHGDTLIPEPAPSTDTHDESDLPQDEPEVKPRPTERPVVRPYTRRITPTTPVAPAPRGGTPNRAPSTLPTPLTDPGAQQWDIPIPGIATGD